MSSFDVERADRLIALMPPPRFDAICTEELVPSWPGLRATLYADAMTLVFMKVEAIRAEGKDFLDEPEKLQAIVERAVRFVARTANQTCGQGVHAPKSEGGAA